MQNNEQNNTEDNEGLTTFTVRVSDDLYRAFQRCTWIMINETGTSQLEIMDELISDFLKKHGC